MQTRIADSFTHSLAKLTGDEQKAVKTSAFDLQLNPSNPGLQFHKLDRAKDKRFWSVRVSRDIRIIVHKTASSILLCYVDHHDQAYDWAERRKLETHPTTGSAQMVEVRETVRDIEIPNYIVTTKTVTKPALFASKADDELLSYGVPAEWLEDVKAADEDMLLQLADHLPREAAEALLELAVGGTPVVPTPIAPTVDPFDHPDARRRFRVMSNVDELKLALDYPWDQWTVFLHPSQLSIVERKFSGPARVAGSAGTGKTVVALHRAVHLANSNPDAKVLLTTFSKTLASSLSSKLRCLIGDSEDLNSRIQVHGIREIGRELYTELFGAPVIAMQDQVFQTLEEVSTNSPDNKFSQKFLQAEWSDVVDAWQLRDWESYRDVKRLGRKKGLGESQRKVLWGIFESVFVKLEQSGLVTSAGMLDRLSRHYADNPAPFDFAVVDEAQDISVPELEFLAEAINKRPDALFFAGDLGQRIFQSPFSWKALGVDVRGRSQTLRINYRTSHQIRSCADQLLPPNLADVDGNSENRTNTVSVFNSPPPVIELYETPEEESEAIGAMIKQLVADGFQPHEIGIFIRSRKQLSRAQDSVAVAGLEWAELNNDALESSDSVAIGRMHLAKGLEFRAVFVIACDDEAIPLQSRIEAVTDESDLEEVYNTERHLLYVACTRARDRLVISGMKPASEFLDDLRS